MLGILAMSTMLIEIASPYDPMRPTPEELENGRPAAPSLSHIWGTDQLGRDYFTRAIYGSRISLSIGFVSMCISIGIGVLVGATAGTIGGWIDQLLMRFTDMALSFPPLIILMALISILSSTNILLIMLLIGILGWMIPARLVRAEFLLVKESEFVVAAKAIGCSTKRIAILHMLRNVLSPIIVAASLTIPAAILQEAAISFLGIGIKPPTPSWGNMLTPAIGFMTQGVWWIGIFPGLLITITALSFNFIGDGLRDSMDPSLRNH